MKLLTKYARITVSTSLLIFFFACFTFLPILNRIFIQQVDDNLVVEKDEIVLYAAKHKSLPDIMPVAEQVTTIKSTEKSALRDDQFETISRQGRKVRCIKFSVSIDEKFYLVTIERSLDRTRNLAYTLLGLLVSTIFLVLLVTLLINRYVLQRLWKPFHSTVLKVKQFKISQAHVPTLEETDIEEFQILNNTLQEAAEKALREYVTLKEFTENAGHELQTPIAVIRAKLDNIIQDQSLSDAQSQAALEAYRALERLHKLNRALIFSVKIDNRQFDEGQQINLKPLIVETISQFKDLISSKQLLTETKVEDTVLNINPVLAHSIIDNLIINSIVHNHTGGVITITCTPSFFCICSTGIEEPLEASKMFDRFYKRSSSPDSQGLGLAIVKQICDRLHFKIDYYYEDGRHTFCIRFASK